jgi:hypothetical protein
MVQNYDVGPVIGGRVHLIDQSDVRGGKTVTNQATEICKQMFKDYGDVNITYTDSEGGRTRLVHSKGIFRYFDF